MLGRTPQNYGAMGSSRDKVLNGDVHKRYFERLRPKSNRLRHGSGSVKYLDTFLSGTIEKYLLDIEVFGCKLVDALAKPLRFFTPKTAQVLEEPSPTTLERVRPLEKQQEQEQEVIDTLNREGALSIEQGHRKTRDHIHTVAQTETTTVISPVTLRYPPHVSEAWDPQLQHRSEAQEPTPSPVLKQPEPQQQEAATVTLVPTKKHAVQSYQNPFDTCVPILNRPEEQQQYSDTAALLPTGNHAIEGYQNPFVPVTTLSAPAQMLAPATRACTAPVLSQTQATDSQSSNIHSQSQPSLQPIARVHLAVANATTRVRNDEVLAVHQQSLLHSQHRVQTPANKVANKKKHHLDWDGPRGENGQWVQAGLQYDEQIHVSVHTRPRQVRRRFEHLNFSRHHLNTFEEALDCLRTGEEVGDNCYPHTFENRGGLPLKGFPPYVTFPLLAEDKIYDGSQAPGPWRVVLDSVWEFVNIIIHDSRVNGGFSLRV